jgi:O-antigen/teichoic acid export membrane protein
MLRGIVSNWFAMLVLGVISVILTPILIHGLGSLYYGMWILASSVVDYYGLLDVGMRWTLFRFVAHLKITNQRAALNEAFVVGFVATASIAIFVIGLTAATVTIFPRFVHMPIAQSHVFAWLLALAGLCVSVAFPTQFLSAYLRGLQRFDLYNLGLVVSGLVRAVLLTEVLRHGLGVLGVSCATVAIGVLMLLLNWWFVRRADPELAWCRFSWRRMRELISYGFYTFLINSGEYLRNYTDSLVIGRMLGVALITPFSIAARLMEYFRSIMTGIYGPLTVQLVELDGQSRHRDLQDAFLRSTRITALLSCLIGFGLILNGRILIRLWIGDAFESSYILMLILSVGYLVAYAQHPCVLIAFARARNYRPLGWWAIVEGAANLLLSIYWARRYGLVGVALGTAVPLLVVNILVQPWYALKALELSAWDYLSEAVARPAATAGLFLGLCWLAGVQHAVSGGFHLVWRLTWQVTLFGVLAYALGLTRSDRHSISRHRFQFATLIQAQYSSTLPWARSIIADWFLL